MIRKQTGSVGRRGVGGYVPVIIGERLLITLTNSVHLDSVSELELTVSENDYVVLTPSSYSSWADMFAANPDKLDYFFTPGDYRSWGTYVINNRSGESGRRRTIRYYDPLLAVQPEHPVNRKGGREAIIDSLDFTGTSSYWLIAGMTFRDPSLAIFCRYQTNQICFDRILFEDADLQNAIRILDGANITVQRSVIRNAFLSPGVDTTAIQVKPTPLFNQSGIRILDNEIYNWGDCVQITAANTDEYDTEILDVIIDGNDFYLTPDQETADGRSGRENGIDVKAGGDAANSIQIINNRIWGWRRTNSAVGASGSDGDAIVIQQAARNVLVQDNIIGECPVGIKEEIYPSGMAPAADTPRDTVVTENYFYNIQKYYVSDHGAVFRPALELNATNNYFMYCTYLVGSAPDSGYVNGGPTFTGNTRVGGTAIRDPAIVSPANPYTDVGNTVLLPANAIDFAYQRKRWTGIEIRTVDAGYPDA